MALVPAQCRPGRYRFEIPTAGALTLVFQTLFLPLSFAGGRSSITLTGGPYVPWSPVFHYLSDHWLPVMSNLGFRAALTLEQAGFYPRGGGIVSAQILSPKILQPFSCSQRGSLSQIRGISGVANLSPEIAKRQKHQTLSRLYPVCRDTKISMLDMPSPVKGTFVLLQATFDPSGRACFTALGAPGKPAEQVADEAVDKLLGFLKTDGCVDQYLADQLLLPLLVVPVDATFRTSKVTLHLLTNAHVIHQFVPNRITIDGDLNTPGTVKIRGELNPSLYEGIRS